MLELALCPSPTADAPLQAQWHQLVLGDPEATVFASPSWSEAWLGVFGDGKRVEFATLSEAGRLVAVVPLVGADVKRGPTLRTYHDIQPEDRAFLRQARRASVLPLRQWAPLANLECGNVRTAMACLPDRHAEAWQALVRGLVHRNDWGVVLLSALPPAAVAAVSAAAHDAGLPVLVDRGPTLYRSTVMRWDDYFKPRHRHFRTRFRSGQQELDKLGGGSVRVCEGVESVALLDRALELAQRSWKQQGRDGEAYHVPVGGAMKRFCHDFAQAHARGQPVPIVCLEMAGHLRAALICAVQGRRLFALQTFFDPDIARASPGARLLPATFDYCQERGLTHIDWNGNNAWVQRFADGATEHAHVCLLRPSVAGRTLHRLASWLRARADAAPHAGGQAQAALEGGAS